MNCWRLVALVVSVLLLAAGCSSPAKHAQAPTTRGTLAAESTVVRAARGRLEFRAVQYDGSDPLQYPYAGQAVCKRLLAKRPKHATVAGQEVLLDRHKKSCYVLGPALITGASVSSASVTYDSTASQWGTDVHFVNDDFILKIARPLINKEVAIVLNGVVQSAPIINPGITGRDVEITGNFTKAQAVDAVASILGITPGSVRVESAGG